MIINENIKNENSNLPGFPPTNSITQVLPGFFKKEEDKLSGEGDGDSETKTETATESNSRIKSEFNDDYHNDAEADQQKKYTSKISK
jgi:hypothetical protein